MAWNKNGNGEGTTELNILLSMTQAVYANADNKDQLQVFVKAWMYQALTVPENLNHIVAGLYRLVRKLEYRQSGLKMLESKLNKKLKDVSEEKIDQLEDYYKDWFRL